jgi:hypothetical protein
VIEQVSITIGTVQYYYTKASLEFVYAFWPDSSKTQNPGPTTQNFWAMRDDANIVLAPPPVGVASGNVTGLWVPAPDKKTQ